MHYQQPSDDSRGVIGVTDVVISEGDTVTLECVAPSQAKWKLNDVSLSPGTKFRFQGTYLTLLTLPFWLNLHQSHKN